MFSKLEFMDEENNYEFNLPIGTILDSTNVNDYFFSDVFNENSLFSLNTLSDFSENEFHYFITEVEEKIEYIKKNIEASSNIEDSFSIAIWNLELGNYLKKIDKSYIFESLKYLKHADYIMWETSPYRDISKDKYLAFSRYSLGDIHFRIFYLIQTINTESLKNEIRFLKEYAYPNSKNGDVVFSHIGKKILRLYELMSFIENERLQKNQHRFFSYYLKSFIDSSKIEESENESKGIFLLNHALNMKEVFFIDFFSEINIQNEVLFFLNESISRFKKSDISSSFYAEAKNKYRLAIAEFNKGHLLSMLDIPDYNKAVFSYKNSLATNHTNLFLKAKTITYLTDILFTLKNFEEAYLVTKEFIDSINLNDLYLLRFNNENNKDLMNNLFLQFFTSCMELYKLTKSLTYIDNIINYTNFLYHQNNYTFLKDFFSLDINFNIFDELNYEIKRKLENLFEQDNYEKTEHMRKSFTTIFRYVDRIYEFFEYRDRIMVEYLTENTINNSCKLELSLLPKIQSLFSNKVLDSDTCIIHYHFQKNILLSTFISESTIENSCFSSRNYSLDKSDLSNNLLSFDETDFKKGKEVHKFDIWLDLYYKTISIFNFYNGFFVNSDSDFFLKERVEFLINVFDKEVSNDFCQANSIDSLSSIFNWFAFDYKNGKWSSKENRFEKFIHFIIHRVGQELYSLLLEPFEKLIKNKKKIIILSNDILKNFSFNLLKTKEMGLDDYLVFDFNLEFIKIPEIKLLFDLSNSNKLFKKASFVGFSNYFTLSKLDNVDSELLSFKENFEDIASFIKTGEDSITIEELSNIFLESDFCAISLHGFKKKLFNHFELGLFYPNNKSMKDDILINFDILSKVPMNKNLSLLVLSICYGGTQIIGNSENYSLLDTFFSKGTRTIVSNIEPLNDSFSGVFFPKFYSYIREFSETNEGDKASAFYKALKESFNYSFGSFKHPFYWAFLEFYGDPNF